ncbi:hypothetical protein A17E_01861 [Escherichia coli KTE220]|nr:hypothetical protein A17E_01861 [Escherichia coli KTE220]
MHEKNIALLCDEADRLLQLNINLLRQMVEEPDVLSDSKNENRLLFDKQKALKRIEELEGEQIKTARREMVLAVVGTMKAGKSTTINAIVGQEILPNRNRPMTSVPTLIRHVPGKTEPVLHLEHIQPVRNLLITLQEKLATPAGQQVAQTLQQTGDTRELLDILTDDGWLKNEYHGEEEIFTGLASLNDLVRLAAAMGTEFPFDEYAEVQKLPVIDVEFSHLVGMDACQGTLTLLVSALRPVNSLPVRWTGYLTRRRVSVLPLLSVRPCAQFVTRWSLLPARYGTGFSSEPGGDVPGCCYRFLTP